MAVASPLFLVLDNWRFTDDLFAILISALLSLLIVALFWTERKAKKLSLVDVPPPSGSLTPKVRTPVLRRIW
ncbi:hypothetical protein C8Q79DRAFT_1123036, partial [Trametes meyenii]